MFEGEVQTAGIQMEFVLSQSYKELDVNWVKLDPSRVLQVRIHPYYRALLLTIFIRY